MKVVVFCVLVGPVVLRVELKLITSRVTRVVLVSLHRKKDKESG